MCKEERRMEEMEKNELKFALGELMQVTVRGADVVHLSNAIVSISGILNRQEAEEQRAEGDQSENAAKKQQEPEKKQK